MKGKPKDNTDNGIPGPGAYEESKLRYLKNSPKWK